jgi:hypothetical protein
LTITAPASSKSYIIINSTSTSQSVKIVGAGPTTGVTLVSGEKAIVAWNGSDFTKVATSVISASALTGTVAPANGGTGVANNAANTLTFSGNFSTTFTLTGNTSITLPTSGTVATKGNAIAFSIVFGL